MTATACTWRMDIFHTQGYSKSSHHIKRTDTALVREAFKTSRCPLISSPIYPRYLRASCSFQVPVWVHSNDNTANSQIHKSPKTASILIQTPCLSDESRSEQQGFSVLPTLETSMLSITETFQEGALKLMYCASCLVYLLYLLLQTQTPPHCLEKTFGNMQPTNCKIANSSPAFMYLHLAIYCTYTQYQH